MRHGWQGKGTLNKMKKRKKLSEKGIVLVILAVIVVVAIIICFIFDWSVFIPKEYKKPQFIITKEECSNFKSGKEIIADTHFNGTILVEDFVDIEVINFRLNRDVFAESLCSRLINEDTIEIKEGCVVDFFDTFLYSDPNLVCAYWFECYYGGLVFHEEEKIRKEFVNIHFDEPQFDHSLVYYNESDNRIHNENSFFDVYIGYETSEVVCKQVRVEGDWKYECIDMLNNSKCFSPYYDDMEWLDENCVPSSKELPNECEDICIEKHKHNINNLNKCVQKCDRWKCGDYLVEVLK